ncbi:MAG: hypothetical protein AAB676_18780 [Verrucomicrobiota bacterium]
MLPIRSRPAIHASVTRLPAGRSSFPDGSALPTITRVLAPVALRIFSSFCIGFASDLVADALAPVKKSHDPEEIVASRRVADAASLAYPAVLDPPCSAPRPPRPFSIPACAKRSAVGRPAAAPAATSK